MDILIQLILIIQGFFTYPLTCSVIFVCNPDISTPGAFTVIHTHAQVTSHLNCSTYVFPVEVEQGNTLPSGFRSHSINKCPFPGLFNTTFSHFVCFVGDFTV